MAGSEQVGLDGASAELFVGATWVLTPTEVTDPAAYALVRTVLADLGANVVALAPAQHDALVAVVSHVPHLTAATLMDLAAGLGEEHAALLQLAAGGLPGHDPDRRRAIRPSGPTSARTTPRPSSRPSTCSSTPSAAMRRRVAEHDHESLLDVLERAADARRALSRAGPSARGAGRGTHPGARPDRDDRRDHRPGHRARHQHRRPGDRPLGGRRPGRHGGGGGPAVGAHPAGHACRAGATGPPAPRWVRSRDRAPDDRPRCAGRRPPAPSRCAGAQP